jgi:hypothetical protein
MVEMRIGNNVFEFGLVQWSEGRALLPVEDEPAPATTATQRKIIGTVGGKVLRVFSAKQSSHELTPRWRA